MTTPDTKDARQEVKAQRVYTIKPLVWEGSKWDECENASVDRANVLGGYYAVGRRCEVKHRWGYFFGDIEYKGFDCESAADGKAQAEAHWNARLSRFLDTAPTENERTDHD